MRGPESFCDHRGMNDTTSKPAAKKPAAKKPAAKKPAATTPAPEASTPPAPPTTPAPQPMAVGPAPMLESSARNLAMWTHLAAILTWLISIPGIAGALVFWLVGKDRSALVDHNGKESVNFQLTVLATLVGGVILGIVTLGLGFLIVIPVWVIGAIVALIFQIQGAAAANRGEYYRYPINWRMIR